MTTSTDFIHFSPCLSFLSLFPLFFPVPFSTFFYNSLHYHGLLVLVPVEANDFIASFRDYWLKVKHKNILIHEKKFICARVHFLKRSPNIMQNFCSTGTGTLLSTCVLYWWCKNLICQKNSLRQMYWRHHLAGVSIKIASIAETTALNFRVHWETQLDVLKSSPAFDWSAQILCETLLFVDCALNITFQHT